MRIILILLLSIEYAFCPNDIERTYYEVVINKGCTYGTIDSIARMIYCEVGNQPNITRLTVGKTVYNRSIRKRMTPQQVLSEVKESGRNAYKIILSDKFKSGRTNLKCRMAAWYSHQYNSKAEYFINRKYSSRDNIAWFDQQVFERKVREVEFYYPNQKHYNK